MRIAMTIRLDPSLRWSPVPQYLYLTANLTMLYHLSLCEFVCVWVHDICPRLVEGRFYFSFIFVTRHHHSNHSRQARIMWQKRSRLLDSKPMAHTRRRISDLFALPSLRAFWVPTHALQRCRLAFSACVDVCGTRAARSNLPHLSCWGSSRLAQNRSSESNCQLLFQPNNPFVFVIGCHRHRIPNLII